MDVAVHDLLRLRNGAALLTDDPQPEWVSEALRRAPFVVVRRAPIEQSSIPVGIRGTARNQRFAAYVAWDNVTEYIPPERLAAKDVWRKNSRLESMPALRSLAFVDELFRSLSLDWGPGGSAGFELATGLAVVTETSDLDVIVRAPDPLPIDIARDIVEQLKKASARVDVLLETPAGAVSLEEYARGGKQVLLRTVTGPRLVSDPWKMEIT